MISHSITSAMALRRSAVNKPQRSQGVLYFENHAFAGFEKSVSFFKTLRVNAKYREKGNTMKL